MNPYLLFLLSYYKLNDKDYSGKSLYITLLFSTISYVLISGILSLTLYIINEHFLWIGYSRVIFFFCLLVYPINIIVFGIDDKLKKIAGKIVIERKWVVLSSVTYMFLSLLIFFIAMQLVNGSVIGHTNHK